MRVLLVDDDDEFREALDAALRQQHIEVEQAGNGVEALALLARRRFDAILLDLMMPVMDGWQFLAAMARDPAFARTPVAILSAAREPRGLPPGVLLLPKLCGLQAVLDFLTSVRR